VADQDGVAALGVERAIGFVGQGVVANGHAAAQGQAGLEMHGLRCDDKTHGNKKPGVAKNEAGRSGGGLSLAAFIKRPQAESKSARKAV
jgi:hypothetical protein